MRAFEDFHSGDGLIADYLRRRAPAPSRDVDAEATTTERAQAAMRQLSTANSRETLRAAAASVLAASHRLRTPLNAIVGFATMLRDGDAYKLDSEKRAEYASYILHSADALLRQIGVMNETASLDAGACEPVCVAIDVVATARDAIAKSATAAQAAQVKLDDKTSAPSVEALGDAAMTAQAFEHLLRAAIERSPAGASALVKVSATEAGGAVFSVRDYGPGLNEDAIKTAARVLADPRQGLGRALRGPGGGVAGAVAMARNLIEAQGGALVVKSREGKGLLAQVELPGVEEDDKSSA
ncbi:MAG: HAMP domain-containing sensor histidine kinase [Pseudomonadota bacterium]